MTDQPSKSYKRLRIEEGSVTPDRVLAYPKGTTLKGDTEDSSCCSQDGVVTPSRPHRFNKDGKLVAIGGVPLTSEPQPSIGDVSFDDYVDDVYGEPQPY